MVWGVHKCSIRGDLMRIGAHGNRQQEAEYKRLTGIISQLETKHKQSLTETSATELVEARKQLHLSLKTKTNGLLFLKKNIYYEARDKSGRLLALQEPTTSKHIMGIKSTDGALQQKP